MSERDPSNDAAATQMAAHRRAGAADRLRIAFDLSDAERELAIANIRKQHPEYTQREVIEAVVWQICKIRLPKPESE